VSEGGKLGMGGGRLGRPAHPWVGCGLRREGDTRRCEENPPMTPGHVGAPGGKSRRPEGGGCCAEKGRRCLGGGGRGGAGALHALHLSTSQKSLQKRLAWASGRRGERGERSVGGEPKTQK
jgi:hypothetical protein